MQRRIRIYACGRATISRSYAALILARVFGNSPDFWLNVQRRTDLGEAMNNLRERIKRAKPLRAA